MMDPNYNPYGNQPYNNPNNGTPNYGHQNYGGNRNFNPMENIAFILGLLSIVTCACCYLSLPMGSIAIVLALLSRGGNMKLSSKAKIAIATGIIGIVLTVTAFTVSFYIAINEYGSIEGILRAYCDQAGLDFEALYGDMFQ